jgi:Tetratricopeptide repeat
MRRRSLRVAVVLSLSVFAAGSARAHDATAPMPSGHGHSRSLGGGGGFHSGGGQAGFGGAGHGSHGFAGPITGHGDIGLTGPMPGTPGTGHGVGDFRSRPDNGPGANAGSYGAVGPVIPLRAGVADPSHLTHLSISRPDIGSFSGHTNRISSGINFPLAPALMSGSGSSPGHRPSAFSAARNRVASHRSSFIHDQVLAASGGGPAEHRVDGQVAQAAGQQAVQMAQAEISHRQVGSEDGHEISGDRDRMAGRQGRKDGDHGRHHAGGREFWKDRSFFFGGSSPFGDPPSISADPSSTASTAQASFFLLPGFGFGFGGYGFGNIFGFPWGGLQALPGVSRVGDDRQFYATYAGGAPRPKMASAVQVIDDVPEEQLDNALDFAGQGEVDFKQGKYKSAVQNWRHALVDDPRNGAIVLLLGQALFALGQYDEAAGATQAALSMLPEEKWGTVVIHYKELYPNIGDYTTQLRALEKARDAKPDVPALHFLLGYHFGYLNYPKHAVRELDKVLAVMPKDKIAQKLRDDFAAKLSDEDKAALEKQSAKPADDGKPPAKPGGSSGTPTDDKDGATKDGENKTSSAPDTDT